MYVTWRWDKFSFFPRTTLKWKSPWQQANVFLFLISTKECDNIKGKRKKKVGKRLSTFYKQIWNCFNWQITKTISEVHVANETNPFWSKSSAHNKLEKSHLSMELPNTKNMTKIYKEYTWHFEACSMCPHNFCWQAIKHFFSMESSKTCFRHLTPTPTKKPNLPNSNPNLPKTCLLSRRGSTKPYFQE